MAPQPATRASRRFPLWRNALLIGFGWLSLNAALYVLLASFEWQPAPREHPISDHVLQVFDEKHLNLSDTNAPDQSRVVRYRLMSPKEPSSDEAYPVVLFLHGAGQRGDDNRSQLKGLPEQMSDPHWHLRFPCFFIAPQCPAGQSWSEQTEILLAILEDVLERYPVDRRRVYLTGLSMGGYGCWELSARRPDLFAAVVPVCGGGDPKTAESLAGLPIWAVHGDADDVIPVERSREMIQAIRQAGGNPRYTELESVGHDSWTPAYSDPEGVIPWMFRQVNSRIPRQTNSSKRPPSPPPERYSSN